MNGFEVFRALPEDKMPYVVFLTAFEEHALPRLRFTRWIIWLNPLMTGDLR